MELSEEKAKEILSFLARKAKKASFQKTFVKIECYDDIKYNIQYNIHMWHLVLYVNYLENPEIASRKMVVGARMHLVLPRTRNIITIPVPSYKKYLDELLELSRKGNDIHAFGGYNWVFLKKNTSLEEILVEMDLATEEQK